MFQNTSLLAGIMKKILDTIYIQTEDSYLSLDNENLVVLDKDNKEIGRFCLHEIESIVSINWRGASPALMEKCAEKNIGLCFLSPTGKFRGRVIGKVHGNVLLRKKQFEICSQKEESLILAKNMILGKLYNSKSVLQRGIRDHELSVDIKQLEMSCEYLERSIERVQEAECVDSVRGIEGDAASWYFTAFPQLILKQKEDFIFRGRNRRPPMDPVNALLSFAYSLLANRYVTALEAVGLDPYSGFLHTDRPGRASLALDMMEELRSVFADRFVLDLINRGIVTAKDFIYETNGAVLLSETGRKKFWIHWDKKLGTVLQHPFLKEKVEWGMIPFVQAQLLARYLRGDLDTYPPFFNR